MKSYLFLFFLFISSIIHSQTAWNWTELDTMPFKISNNAVTQADSLGEQFVYSFGGIDQSKIHSGIVQNSYKYQISTGIWTQILPLPSTLANIAAGASTVKNKIYIIGGYHVYPNGNELSSNEVIIYDPTQDIYQPNGTNLPTPIDDHVQCVWRDSLIYVITGWSNSGNVPNVQIYNPSLDSWSTGTNTPNNHNYKAFGASGNIIGDTIYYYGGAQSSNGFNAVSKLRKGVIDQNDPTQITWTLESDAPNSGYRSACITHGTNIFWIGGSSISYNYNGIAYNGSGGVSPLTQIMRYSTINKVWYPGLGAPHSVMDMRGVAQLSPTSWIICGGMNQNQEVTNRTFLLNYDPITGNLNSKMKVKTFVYNRQIYTNSAFDSAKIYDLSGRLIQTIHNNLLPADLNGIYIVEIETLNGHLETLKISL